MRKKKSRLSVGNHISLNFGGRQVQGEIIEDRGPLAAGGRRLYRVRVMILPDESLAFELPEDEIIASANGGSVVHR